MGCSECKLWRNVNTKCIKGTGSLESELLIVLDPPSQLEDEYGRINFGKTYNKLQEAIKHAGLDTSKIRITNAVKCRITYAIDNINDNLLACKDNLFAEIASMPNLKLIVPMGNIPLFVLLNKVGCKKKPGGITNQRGKFQPLEDFSNVTVMPMLSPSSVLRNPADLPNFLNDMQRAATFLNGGIVEAQKQPVDYRTIYTIDELKWLREQLKRTDVPVVFDLETTSKDTPYGTRILNISFSWGANTSVYLPINECDNGNYWVNTYDIDTWVKVRELLKEWFENPEIKKIGHNLKYDVSYTEVILGFAIKGVYFCTMLAHYLLDNLTEHGLKPLTDKYTDLGTYDDDLDEIYARIKKDKTIPPERRNYGSIPLHIIRQYALTDADATYRLYNIFKYSIDQSISKDVFYSILMPLTRVIADMEKYGVGLDLELAHKLSEEFQQRLDAILDAVTQMAGRPINIKSPKQLKELIFGSKEDGGLGLKATKFTPKGNVSVDAKVLEELADKHNIPILHSMVEYRSVATIKSTAIDGAISAVDPITGRVHPGLKMHGTTSGRLAGGDPYNILNIPRDSDDCKIRNMFIPVQRPNSKRRRVFVDGDVSGAEFRILGEISRDPVMAQLFADKVDIHRRVASIALDIPEDKVTKAQRTSAKALVFGLMYGRSTESVALALKISISQGEKFKAAFFALCPGAEKWIEAHKAKIRKEKFVTSIFGRVRLLPNIDSDNQAITDAAIREGLNMPIQSAAADYVFVALISIYNEFKQRGLDAIPVISVYDSILTECWEDEAQEVYDIMQYYMTRPIGPVCHVPMEAELAIVDRWSGKEIELAA